MAVCRNRRRRSRSIATIQKPLPRFWQFCILDFACNASLKFGTKNGAGPIDHDHLFRSFYSNGVRDAGGNDNSRIVTALMIVAIDEETHNALGKSSPHIAQNHLHPSLEKKHDVPLFVIVTTQRIILRYAHEQTSQPFLGGRIERNTRWMDMKSFCAECKHARSRPLLRPKSNFRQDSLVTADKFTKNSAMTLGMDRARKNFHAGNPRALYLRPRPVRLCQFAGRNTCVRDSLRQRAQFIIARTQCISRRLAHAQPQTCFAFVHISLFKGLLAQREIRTLARKIWIVIRIAMQNASPALLHYLLPSHVY